MDDARACFNMLERDLAEVGTLHDRNCTLFKCKSYRLKSTWLCFNSLGYCEVCSIRNMSNVNTSRTCLYVSHFHTTSSQTQLLYCIDCELVCGYSNISNDHVCIAYECFTVFQCMFFTSHACDSSDISCISFTNEMLYGLDPYNIYKQVYIHMYTFFMGYNVYHDLSGFIIPSTT